MRHFVLRENSIAYYAKEGDSKLRGELEINASTVLEEYPKKPFAFVLVTGDKSLTAAASSAEEEVEWRDGITTVLAQVCTVIFRCRCRMPKKLPTHFTLVIAEQSFFSLLLILGV